MVEHVRRVHLGAWECKLPGCKGSKSRFTRDRLRTHLIHHHNNFALFDGYVEAAAHGDNSVLPDEMVGTCGFCAKHRAQSD